MLFLIRFKGDSQKTKEGGRLYFVKKQWNER